MQAFGAKVFGIVRGKSVTYDWLVFALNTIAFTSKLSQKLETISLIPVVSGVGNYQKIPAFMH